MPIFSARRLLALMGAAGLIVPLAATHGAAGAARTLARETTTREFPLARGGRLTVQTGRGDITIQAWTRAAIELKAVKTGDSDSDLVAIPIDIRAAADEVNIASPAPAGAGVSHTRVDYQLRVPADVDLKLVRTGRGRVQIAGTNGRAVVQVENGTVRITDFSGGLEAVTVNGEVDVAFSRVDPNESIRIETFNGDIRLRLPKAVSPHFQVRTLSGSVQSEFPITVEKVFGPQVAHDAGTPDAPFVNLVSVTGDIHISRR